MVGVGEGRGVSHWEGTEESFDVIVESLGLE